MDFLSLSHLRDNIAKFSQAVLKREYEPPLPLKDSYAKSIQTIRGIECTPEISIQFHTSDIAKEAISQGVFSESANINDIESIQSDSYKEHCRQLYEDAMELISKHSTDLRELVDTVVTDVVFVYSPRVGGGSGSHLPGVICISIDDNWTSLDVANTLIHESTHLSTFICDMVNKMFSKPASELDKEEYRVLSAVRVGDLRPLDKAIHSAFVTVPLLYFEQLIGKDEMMNEFSKSLDDCVQGTLEKIDLLTPYGKELVFSLAAFNKNRDFSLVEESFT
ncbi:MULTISPECIES: aKG-HExxH-type peptide beta-hydroxylase [Vibrio]|uniref:aKG-HExxH-type peptide beta-hydroxylase n=1 Tax=Vibrio TaxID=662 RepID=UPI000E0C7675|nr:HEXXH motif-containing putative peptide modification protein [Vibrio tetraodonis]